MNRVVIGIDPGLKGGVCALVDGSIDRLESMPLRGAIVNVPALVSIFRQYKRRHVVIEAVGLRPSQSGVVTMVANWARLLAAAEVLGIEPEIVQPKTWQRDVTDKEKLAAFPKVQRRGELIRQYCEFAQRTYPKAPLMPQGKRVIQDGLAAALLIARWKDHDIISRSRGIGTADALMGIFGIVRVNNDTK